ncbi:MAG: hypothetical protein CMG34_04310 [Candidatus Marinimicrobia bacterium]|nr:hypothetical protein [Candidatus Neomarinimicrobiota bacterium]|tara:strand:- start:835 stop:1536 length:702 start_codon:yes stop_codon:yes gene_type:complete
MKIFKVEDSRCDLHDQWWHDQDSEEKFKANLKTAPKDWKYRTETITYRTNSYGYRTKEFNKINWKKSIVLFGCSLVFGVGVNEEDTIAAQLSEITGQYVVNMGVCGASSQYSVHNLSCLLSQYKPDKIVIGWSSYTRTPLYQKERVVHCGNWRDDPAMLGLAYRRYTHHGRTMLEIYQQIAKQLGMDAEFTLFDDMSLDCEYIHTIDKGRDLSHGGVQTYKKVANCIAEQLFL